MQKELQAMKELGVYNEVHATSGNYHTLTEALPTLWVQRPSGDEICCRLLYKGCYQYSMDKGDTYAINRLLISLKLFLLIGLSNNRRFNYDISTASMDGREHAMPGHPMAAFCGDYEKAMYGLKAAPEAWRLDFAETMANTGAKRLRSQPNVYYFPKKNLYAMTCPQHPHHRTAGRRRWVLQ